MRWWQIKKRDADLERELRSDLELEEEEQREGGVSGEEARYAALRAFGNPTLIRDQTHAVWSWSWIESLARDLRFSLRTLRRTPGFTIIAILVMALGIGANVALFTVVRGVLLKPLPFHDPDRLVMLYEAGALGDDTTDTNVVSGGMYAEWKKQNRSYSSLALAQGIRVGLSGSGGQLPEKLRSALFSWDMLRTLGVQPALGRDFTQADDSPTANGTVLLSWGLWKRRFGGDPGILNQTIELDAAPFTVIGVMPAWFDFPDPSTQLWTPVYHDKPEAMMTSLNNHMFRVVGRLKPGVTAAQGVADLSLISQRIHNAHLDDPFVFRGASSRPLLEHLVGEIRKPLYVLLEATCCLLLIACLNVANLLVARAAARRKELAIRTALGGGWLRLMSERMMECLMLSAAGGVLGLLLAFAALHWLSQARHDMSRVDSIHIDGVVAAFTVGVIMLCALFSGLIAAFSNSDRHILGALHEASRSVGGGTARATLRKVLLMLEVGLTVILLVGAGLLLKSYERLRSADMGCITQGVITMHLGLPDARYATPAQRANFYDSLLERVRALPGVDAAGFATLVPGQGYEVDSTFNIVEHPPLPQGRGLYALSRSADPKYFGAMGIPILRGRTFDGKRLAAADEVIISQSFASQYFPGEDPLGKHLHVHGQNAVIVGIVGDTRYAIGETPRPVQYFSLDAGVENVGTLVIRSSHDPEQFALPVQRIVSEMDRDLPVSDVLTMNQLLGKSTQDQSFNTTLLVAFGSLSLVLAAVGLFGVMSYIGAQRTTEIGIRIALGARREQVMRKMLLDGMQPAVFGLVVGLTASLAAGRLMRDLLYQIKPLDPAVFAAVAATLLAVAVFACIVPAWRASRLDPMKALRAE
ncbi:ABC transporter permease [Tunturiibacter gelidoferens]|uniref:Putative ABC transport system permease protein n=1 Tax=Tunturiibacter lichenicola TaxID=2051959 RepID=A0A7Y9NR90_9BACT|nr:ABC transporter permease [Edaphobacter lichenicola]NYF53498.1 putative ABC transport system permease protein [Edaphobacter lichenicola]